MTVELTPERLRDAADVLAEVYGPRFDRLAHLRLMVDRLEREQSEKAEREKRLNWLADFLGDADPQIGDSSDYETAHAAGRP